MSEAIEATANAVVDAVKSTARGPGGRFASTGKTPASAGTSPGIDAKDGKKWAYIISGAAIVLGVLYFFGKKKRAESQQQPNKTPESVGVYGQ